MNKTKNTKPIDELISDEEFWNEEKYEKLLSKNKLQANIYVAQHNNYMVREEKKFILDTHKIDVSLFNEQIQNIPEMKSEKYSVLLLKQNTDIAARLLKEEYDYKFCLLNFADSHRAGGEYLSGLETQEEELCRVAPGLWPSLALSKNYPFDNYNTVLYTENVLFVRDSTKNYNMLNNMFKADIITAAAPQLGIQKLNMNKLYSTAKTIFLLPKVKYNAECIILGAWGCGAFSNSPDKIAGIFIDLINKYGGYYKLICFAIPDATSENYQVFYDCLKRNKLIL